MDDVLNLPDSPVGIRQVTPKLVKHEPTNEEML